jgi:RNA polymerase sigma-70 factor, ECF subfamily
MVEEMSRSNVTLAQAGADEFQNRVDPYRRELLLHCYRFFGSMDDAEDAVQDTLIRAWRRLDTLKEQTSRPAGAKWLV